MANIQNLSETPLSLDQSLSVLENNTTRLNALILNIHGAVARNKEKRRELIAEARTLLEPKLDVRMSEILDELERLP